MEHGEEVFRHGRILGMEEAGTSQNPFPPVGRRMIDEFPFSGRKFTATLGLDQIRLRETILLGASCCGKAGKNYEVKVKLQTLRLSFQNLTTLLISSY